MKQFFKDLYKGAKVAFVILSILSVVAYTVAPGNFDYITGALGISMFIGLLVALHK